MSVNRVLWVNVNGRTFDFTAEATTDPFGESTVKIYNLFPYKVYAVDIYLVSKSHDAMAYLSARNYDNTPKMQIVLDGSFPWDIGIHSPGLKFSDPITYYRHDIKGMATYWLPSNINDKTKQIEYQFLEGSDHTAYGKDWTALVNTPYSPNANYNQGSYAFDHNINSATNDFLPLTIRKSPLTNIVELSNYMKDVIIVVQPSEFLQLDPAPQYSIDDFTPPLKTDINIRY